MRLLFRVQEETAETLNHYRAQVAAYLNMSGAERGLIVFVTTGQVITVTPTHPRPWPLEEKGADAVLTRGGDTSVRGSAGAGRKALR